jgi:O-antigen ligase
MTLRSVGPDRRQAIGTALEPTTSPAVLRHEGLARHSHSIGRRPAESQTPIGAPAAATVPLPRGPRRVGYLIALAVWTMPLLSPSGPGNTGLADVTMGAALIMTITWLYRSGGKVVVPYSLGIGIFMIAGSLAALHQPAPYSGLTILQDLFLLLWGAALANAVQRPWLLRVFVQAWCWSGIAWASVLVFARLAGLNAVAGITVKDGGRAALTFNDPNLAGSYFLCALLVLLATRAIRGRWIRFLGVILILTAIVLTGSNGAAVGLSAGLGVAAVVRVRKTQGPVLAIAVVALLLALAGLAGPYLDLSPVRQKAADSVQLLRDSIGRSDESASERERLFSEGIHLFRTGDLIGVGPGRTKFTLAAQAAPYVKEAHNDYVATLVERGFLGGIGLIILISAIGVRLTRVAVRPLPPDVAALIPRPEYLLGLGCAFLCSGFFYEVLHFRHLWAFLGFVAGLDMIARGRWDR